MFSRDAWMLAGPALVFLFYLAAWVWIGREPKPGAMVARYEPPAGLSPATVRFITAGTSDGRSLAAVIAQLAVRGCLRVEPIDGKYKLSRLLSDQAAEAGLAAEEKRVLAMLFEDGPVIELSPGMDESNTAQNGRYVFHIHEELAKQIGGKYFTRHMGIIALGVMATFLLAMPPAALAHGQDAFESIFLTAWVLFTGLMLGLIVELSLAGAWRAAIVARTGWMKLLPGTAAIGVFAGFIVYLLTKLGKGVSPSFSLMLALFLLINLAWWPRLKRKTPLGRETCDQIAGFRMFLEKVEQEQLDRLNPADNAARDRDLNRLLPFAIALEVKEAWGDQLAQTFFACTVVAEE